MKLTRVLITFLVGLLHCILASAKDPAMLAEQQAAQFMDGYLAVYNRRLNHPERSAQFRSELAEIVHTPLLLSPPTGAPQVPQLDDFTNNFEGFVTNLEGKGVVRLQWHQTQFHALSPNKVLANNIGHGVTAGGDVAYETISLYLLYRATPEQAWQIVMFSPYSKNNPVSLN